MNCKECDYSGQGTKICPICYQRLIKENNNLNKKIDLFYEELVSFMYMEFSAEVEFKRATIDKFHNILKG